MHWALFLALPALVAAQCISEDDSATGNDTEAKMALIKGQQLFSLELLRTLNQMKHEDKNTMKRDENIFFSPHSIYQSLLLAYFTAANETEKIIQKALHLPETQTKIETLRIYGMENYFQSMREANGSDSYTYQTANKMFIAKDLPTKECIGKMLSQELEALDFQTDSSGALKHINGWVYNITRGHIKDLVPASGVHENTKLILANAAYFKGLWKSKFLSEQTKKNDLFYGSTSDIRFVDMMSQKGTFNYLQSEYLKAHILELPYKGGDVSMIFILPRFGNQAIDELIKSLNEEALKDILDFEAMYPRPIEVKIPKFTVEEELELKEVFSRIGLSEMFTNGSDYSTLTGGDGDIHFDGATHKAKVDVDEEGTVAAAATAIFSFRSSRPLDPTTFHANHPFIYIIYDKASQNMLFMGVFKNPTKKQYKKKIFKRFNRFHRL